MSRYIIPVVLFLLFMALAIFCTAVVYLIFYGVVVWISSSFDLPARYSWVPLVVTSGVFLIAVVTTIRNRIPDLTRLSWDSGSSEESPSRISVRGKGGYLWNVNPLGPQSIGSIASIGAAFFCAGPSLAITAVVTVVDKWKKRS